MSVELDDLQETIEQDGWTSEYKNGENQYGTKKSPEAETYIALSKNYAAVIKQLTDLVPAAKRKKSRLEALRKSRQKCRIKTISMSTTLRLPAAKL